MWSDFPLFFTAIFLKTFSVYPLWIFLPHFFRHSIFPRHCKLCALKQWQLPFVSRLDTQVNSALHPSGVAKSSTSFGWGKGGKVTSAGWQVTLCDPIWRVISCSGVMILITNCYIRFSFYLCCHFLTNSTWVTFQNDLAWNVHCGGLFEVPTSFCLFCRTNITRQSIL